MGFQIGDFELDTRREMLFGPGGPIPLRRQAYRLLLLLAEHAPALVPRDTLIDTLWGRQALSPNVLPQTLSELRQALGDDPQVPRVIATRHRRGYALIAPVRRLPQSVAASDPAATTAALAVGRLLLAVDAEDAALRAQLKLLATAASHWALLELHPLMDGAATSSGPAPHAAHAGAAPLCQPPGAWLLQVDAFGGWQIHAPDGSSRANGRLPVHQPLAWPKLLLQALAESCGRPGLAAEAARWPAEPAAREAMAALARSLDHGQPAAALQALDSLGPHAGWLALWRAEACAHAGDMRAAMAALTAPGGGAEPKLALRIDALRSRLAGLPNESLAALRACTLVVPEDADIRLALLDAQLGHAQWAAAAETLVQLRALLGEADPRVLLRQARWCAACQPLQADAAFSAAQARATRLARPAFRRQLQLQVGLAWAQWLLERNRFDDANTQVAQLAEVAADLPELLLLQAWLYCEKGRIKESQQACRTAAEKFTADGRLADARHARLRLAEAALRTGDPRGATALAHEQLEAAAAHDDHLSQGDWLVVLGRALAAQGQFEPARAALHRAIDMARSQADARRSAIARYHLGAAHALERQRPQEAEHAFRMAAEAFRGLSDDLWEVKCLGNLALMAERAGRRLDARAAYADALSRLRGLGVPHELGRLEFNAGVNERELGDLDAAARHLDVALETLAATTAVDLWTMTAAARADLAMAQADVPRAQVVLQAAAAGREHAAPLAHSCWCTAMARACDLADRVDEADRWLDEALALRAKAGVRAALIDGELRRLCLHLNTPAQAARAPWPLQRMASELQRMGEAKFALFPGIATVAAALVSGDNAAAHAQAEALLSAVHAQGNRVQQLQLEWLLALSSQGAERNARLQALLADAQAAGYHLLTARTRLELAAAGSSDEAAAQAWFRAHALHGVLRSPAGLL